MTLRRIAAAAALALFPLTLAAQGTSAPEAATRAYIEAMTAGELDRMAGMMHPQALATFRSILEPVVELAERNRELSGEVLQMFARVDSVAQLRTLSNARFFAAFFEGITAMQHDLMESLATSRIEVLGHVAEGADVAHVLYRISPADGPVSRRTEVVSLRRTGDGWAVLLSGEIEGMAESIRQSLEMQR